MSNPKSCPNALPKPISPASILPWEDGLIFGSSESELPGLSIVIPIYNSASFLERTLRSLLCNHLDGVELILMDGASTDATMQIVDHYRTMFAHVVSEKDKGQSDAINKGFERATQPILYWLNGDDIVLPGVLDTVRNEFREHPDTEVLVGDAFMTEIDFTPIRHFAFSAKKLELDYLLDYASHHLIQPSVFFTRKAWNAAGPVKIDHHYAMDADLFLTMAEQFSFRHLKKDLAYSVYHEGCKTRGSRAESITELAMVQAAHGGLAQARNTLDILVSLYREAENSVPTPTPAGPLPEGDPDVIRRRLSALQEIVARNCQALIDADLQAV